MNHSGQECKCVAPTRTVHPETRRNEIALVAISPTERRKHNCCQFNYLQNPVGLVPYKGHLSRHTVSFFFGTPTVKGRQSKKDANVNYQPTMPEMQRSVLGCQSDSRINESTELKQAGSSLDDVLHKLRPHHRHALGRQCLLPQSTRPRRVQVFKRKRTPDRDFECTERDSR